jgi:hypothetical protein
LAIHFKDWFRAEIHKTGQFGNCRWFSNKTIPLKNRIYLPKFFISILYSSKLKQILTWYHYFYLLVEFKAIYLRHSNINRYHIIRIWMIVIQSRNRVSRYINISISSLSFKAISVLKVPTLNPM